ncbi:hypothetical protein BKA65DRAFT_482720 [Rhexocercosporidium sp. MPI-PUGE-AT-0058]|nr:hypothetical protein BKA65DRAFT_482720 [Rhexocercosporidium sp. MPI-PUGE-AT-0058]
MPYEETRQFEHDPNDYRPLLQTLLHEMLHAFFEIYFYNGGPEGPANEDIGVTRHGAVWQDVAHEIELATLREWGFGDMNRLDSFAREWVESHVVFDRSMPGDADMTRWGFNREDLEEDIKALRSIKMKAKIDAEIMRLPTQLLVLIWPRKWAVFIGRRRG